MAHKAAFIAAKKISQKIDVPTRKLLILKECLRQDRLTDFKGEVLPLFIEAQEEVPKEFILNLDAEIGYSFISGLVNSKK